MIILTLLIVLVDVFGHLPVVLMSINFSFFLFLLSILDFLGLRIIENYFHHIVFDSISFVASINFVLLGGTGNCLFS
jgi:hypothetical protein